MIETLTSKFDEDEFLSEFSNIYDLVCQDDIYQKHYTKYVDGIGKGEVYNYKWSDGEVSSIALKVGKESLILKPDEVDLENAQAQNTIKFPFWYPDEEFPTNPSINHKFIKDIGGSTFSNLWTKRNLYILSKIFHLISKVTDRSLQLQLLSGFIQTLHLCSKMVVPRNPKSKRDFSGSWGRADYMIRRRSMEQNPLIVFKRSCVEKQSILYAMRDFQKQFPNGVKINDVRQTKKINPRADINYGAIDIADISNYLKPESIDFIITDPPYAGLVFYLDLSMIWLVWLKNVDQKYTPDLRAEITIKKGSVDRSEYTRKLGNAFKQMHGVLKRDSFLVVTFHHQKIQEWNDFVKSVKFSGFKFDKVTHQYNRRSGESNVSNPYGTSGADFYIRCVKNRTIDFSNDISGLEHFIVEKSKEIISLRNQPTPHSILISGLIPEMLQAGFFQPDDYKNEINRILEAYSGDSKIFLKIENDSNKAGDYWWFVEPKKHINFPDLPLNRRVEETVISFLRRRVSVKFDDVLAEIFRTFPNGLTPDPRSVVKILETFAFKSSERWKIKEETFKSISEHTRVIEVLISLAKKIKKTPFVGKREQPEQLGNGIKLSDLTEIVSLQSHLINYKRQQIMRIEMIDCVWLNEDLTGIDCIFEVENSTDFTSAIQRGSNLSSRIKKYMIIPDSREKEIKRINDPYFIQGFIENNWSYLLYKDIKMLKGYSKFSMDELHETGKVL